MIILYDEDGKSLIPNAQSLAKCKYLKQKSRPGIYKFGKREPYTYYLISYNEENKLIIENNDGILQANPILFLGEEPLTKKEIENLILTEPNEINLIKKALGKYFSQTKPKFTEEEEKENREIRRAKGLLNLSMLMPYGVDGSNAFDDLLGD